MKRENITSSLWLNLVSSLQKQLDANLGKVNNFIELKKGGLDVFPEYKDSYNMIFAELNTDFLKWKRWYIQCFSHQLRNRGYFFVKGYEFPKLRQGLRSFISNLLRWFFWNLACFFNMPLIQRKLLSKKFLAMTKLHGLYLVTFPSELEFLSRQGICFQKRGSTEDQIKKQLTNQDIILNQIKTNYADRLIKDSSIELNDSKTISIVNLLPKKNGTVLVLAPHPDDELVGCGGTLLALSRLGANIHVLQMSEGSTCTALKNEKETIKQTVRWKEAEIVAQRFKFGQYYWCSNSDQELDSSKESEVRLLELVQKLNPDLIFAPSDTDKHIEHQIAFKLLSKVLREYTPEVLVLKYPVWGSLQKINYAIDITDYEQDVLDAMYHYKTAMKAEDYSTRIQTIWAYQGLMITGDSKRYIEVFSN
ncbi:PIG-L deacetylase family protein [Winogradskyella sediminis]|uniref:PIG-L deacetylase family protein n=1 Tax=Winogradskyella sediminis TaxID=1382466 RepID=UPI003AA9E1FA